MDEEYEEGVTGAYELSFTTVVDSFCVLLGQELHLVIIENPTRQELGVNIQTSY